MAGLGLAVDVHFLPLFWSEVRTVSDEGSEPFSEPVGLGEVDHVAAPRPLLDLCTPHVSSEMLAVHIAERLAHDGEVRNRNGVGDRIDTSLQLGWCLREQLGPIAEDEILANGLGRCDLRPHRGGQRIDAHALTNRLER
jgi:hypothetical protein